MKKVLFLKSDKAKEILGKLQAAQAAKAVAVAVIELQAKINNNIQQGKPFFLDNETYELVNDLFLKIQKLNQKNK